MNKEQQQIIDEAYENYLKYTINGIETGLDKIKGYLDGCLVEYDGYYEHFTNPSFVYGYRTHNQEEFINKCKPNSEFSNKWGLKIEEIELSLNERVKLYGVEKINTTDAGYYEHSYAQSEVDEANTPTKIITITYNNETIESYE